MKAQRVIFAAKVTFQKSNPLQCNSTNFHTVSDPKKVPPGGNEGLRRVTNEKAPIFSFHPE